MQTFLPYESFEESAKVLDMKRLGKQRSEALTLARGAWQNHPASKMWKGHKHSLCKYGIAICKEWIGRGYRDGCLPKFEALLKETTDSGPPSWLGNEDFHRSHQSNLVRKNSEYYLRYFPDVPDNLPYIWPMP